MSYRFLASDASLTTSTSGDRSSAPSYTAKPQADEITLQGSFVSAMPMGEYEQASGPLTLRLRGQIEGISKPVVFHKQRVTGAIIIRLEECTGATQISLKVKTLSNSDTATHLIISPFSSKGTSRLTSTAVLAKRITPSTRRMCYGRLLRARPRSLVISPSTFNLPQNSSRRKDSEAHFRPLSNSHSHLLPPCGPVQHTP